MQRMTLLSLLFTVRRWTTTILDMEGQMCSSGLLPEMKALLSKVVIQNHLINTWTKYDLWKAFLTDGFHSLWKAQCFQLSFTVHTLLGKKSLRFCPINPFCSYKIFGMALDHIHVSPTRKWFIGFFKKCFSINANICVLSLCFVSAQWKENLKYNRECH